MQMVRDTHLVEPGRDKAGQDLAVAENQYPGHGGVDGKNLSFVLPLQLGPKDYVGAVLQVGQPTPESKQHCPGYGEEQNRPAYCVASLRQGLVPGGFGVGSSLNVQNRSWVRPWTFIVLQPLR